MDGNDCQVCASEPSIGVAAVLDEWIAWGRRCLDENAIPQWIAESTHDQIGGDSAELAEWFLDQQTWVDGKYVSVRDHLAGRVPEDIYAGMDELPDGIERAD